MKGETVASILNPQTTNLNSTGGGGFEAIGGGDIGAVMMAVEADELTWSYFFAYYEIGLVIHSHKHIDWKIEKKEVRLDGELLGYSVKFTEIYRIETNSYPLNQFTEFLRPWIYHQWLNWSDAPMPERVQKAATASEEISKGLALYLSKNPKEEVKLSPYFAPIKPDTFRRKYKKFAIMASRRLFPKIVELSNKIHDYTKKEENI